MSHDLIDSGDQLGLQCFDMSRAISHGLIAAITTDVCILTLRFSNCAFESRARFIDFDSMHGSPLEIPGVAPSHATLVVQAEKVQPSIVEERTDIVVPAQDIGHGLARRFDANRQAQWFVRVRFAVMDRLPRESAPQEAAISLDDANAARDVVQELIPAAKNLRRHCRAIVLQADPARDNDGRGQDHFENTEALVLLPVIIMQKHASFEVLAGGPLPGGGNKRAASGESPFRACLAPVAGAAAQAP